MSNRKKAKRQKKKPLLNSRRRPQTRTERTVEALSGFAFDQRSIIFGLFLLAVMLPPFFRGLFFRPDQDVEIAVVAGLFLVWWFHKYTAGEGDFLRTPQDWAVLALPVVYVLSTFVAVRPHTAVQLDLVYGMFFVIYWLSSQMVRGERFLRGLLSALLLSATGVAFVGLWAAINPKIYPGAYLGTGVHGRIYSTLQYPNSFAAFMVGASLFALTLWLTADREGKGWRRELSRLWFPMAGALCFAGFILAYSRGVDLVFPVVYLIFLVFAPKGERLRFASYAFAMLAAAAVGAEVFRHLQLGPRPAQAWGAVVLLPVLAAGLGFVAQRYMSLAPGRRTALGGGILAVLVLGGAAVLIHHPPQALVHRTASIAHMMKDHNVLERFAYWRTALSIVAQHPILGTGGGGWSVLYFKYQHYPFSSTQVHNDYLQTWVEAGTIGLLALLAVWVLFLRQALRWRAKAEGIQKLYPVGVATAALAIGLHAALDFDISLAALGIYLWSLFGAARGMTAEAKPAMVHKLGTRFAWAALAGALLLIIGILFKVSADWSQAGTLALQGKNASQAVVDFQRAARYDPLKAGNYLGIAEADVALGSGSPFAVGKPQTYIQKALALEPVTPKYNAQAADLYYQMGNQAQAVAYFRKALREQPYVKSNYLDLAEAGELYAQSLVQSKKRAEARPILQEIAGLPAKMESRAKQAPFFAFPSERLAASSSHVELAAGQAAAMLGNWQAAGGYLSAAGKNKATTGEADLWLGAVLAKQGKTKQSQVILAKAYAADKTLQGQYPTVMGVLG